MRHVEVVLGAITHYARADLVTLAWQAGAPRLLDRRAAPLIDDGLPSAPYHHEALEMKRGEARALVDQVRASVAACADAVIQELHAAFRLRAVIVPASPCATLPTSLDEVLASHKLTRSADGMLYREFLADAAARAGLEVVRLPRQADPHALAAEAHGTTLDTVDAWIAGCGREAGAPWRKDHKLAAAAALSLLGARPS